MGDFPLSQQCRTITAELINDPLAYFFVQPFTGDKKIMNDYHSKVKCPMDLTTVRKRIKDNYYSNIHAWANDIRLIFSNAVAYNGEMSIVGVVAIYLRKKFEKKMQVLEGNNLRNYESQLIALGRELEAIIRRPPPAFNVECKYETATTDDEDFTVARIQKLREDLQILISAGKGSAIATVLRECDADTISPDVSEIDLAHLGRRSLLELEGLVKNEGIG
jgi:hypothetical protein